jgi:hypothetical protein
MLSAYGVVKLALWVIALLKSIGGITNFLIFGVYISATTGAYISTSTGAYISTFTGLTSYFLSTTCTSFFSRSLSPAILATTGSLSASSSVKYFLTMQYVSSLI